MPNATGPVIPADERIKYGHEVDRIVWKPNASNILVECSTAVAGWQIMYKHRVAWCAEGKNATWLLQYVAARFETRGHWRFCSGLDRYVLCRICWAILAIEVGKVQFDVVGSRSGSLATRWAVDSGRVLLLSGRLSAEYSVVRLDVGRKCHEEVLSGAMRLLKHFPAKTNMTVTEPIGFVRSQWFSNPNFRGSDTWSLFFNSLRCYWTGLAEADRLIDWYNESKSILAYEWSIIQTLGLPKNWICYMNMLNIWWCLCLFKCLSRFFSQVNGNIICRVPHVLRSFLLYCLLNVSAQLFFSNNVLIIVL